MRKLLAFIAVVLSTSGVTSTAQAHSTHVSVVKSCPGIVKGVYYYRGVTRKYERKLGRTPSKSDFNASKIHSCKYALWVAHMWSDRAAHRKHDFNDYLKKLREQRQSEGALTSDWACIHHYEGAWNANTGNGYYGGLQMDMGFQSTYGPEFLARWGTADNWPVWAQVTAANRAKNSGRGYGPWPNTARACGLL